MKKIIQGPMRPIIMFSLFALSFLSFSRIALSIWHFERVGDVQGWWHVLIQGIRVDVATLCWLLILPAMLSVLLPTNGSLGRIWRWVFRGWLTIGLWILVYMEVSTPPFIIEYDLRPNRVFVEYLVYPKEVFGMLWVGYKFELLIGAIATLLSIWFGWKWSGRWIDEITPVTWRWRPIIALIVIATGVLGARSTLGHRPLNPAYVAFAPDPLVNELVLNSSYSLFFAIDNMRKEQNAMKFYGEMPERKVIDLVRKSSAKDGFIESVLPTMNENPAFNKGIRKNLVILLQESLGARFVGKLGGLPLTPNLDKLLAEGWSFTQMYATGTRSVRGIEAMTTGFPPSPSRAVVKLTKSQTRFFTIADLLGKQGYETQFIYGGEGHFDNMKSFLLGNGFQKIFEESDYPEPLFKGSWGVSDEDLYNKAHDEFTRLSSEDQPFFSLVFTSSNHSPFEYPTGKINPYDDVPNTRNNAIKYADYALGQFLAKAKDSNYWDNTVFIVIADHDARATGSHLVPVDRFHIPAVIFGKGIAPREDDRIASNIDMPPTLLSLIGVNAVSPMIGRDMTKPLGRAQERAMMQFDKNYGYLTRDSLVVFSPGEKVATYHYNFNDNSYEPVQLRQEDIDTAKANALFGSMAYQNDWYQTNSP